MYNKILLALDLEGVNNVCGEPYSGLLWGSEEWETAYHQATPASNSAVQAVFDAGVEKVALLDNHGGGNNIVSHELDDSILDKDAHTVVSKIHNIEVLFCNSRATLQSWNYLIRL